jgi:ABC-type transport system involved in cytochrome c biogenesis permease component
MDNATFMTLQKLLPLLIPVVIVQIILLAAALYDWFKQPTLRGPKWVWLLVILFVNIVGPIIYFLAARKEE